MAMHRDDCERLTKTEQVSVWLIRARKTLGRWGRALLRPGSISVRIVALIYGVCALLKVEDVPSDPFSLPARPGFDSLARAVRPQPIKEVECHSPSRWSMRT